MKIDGEQIYNRFFFNDVYKSLISKAELNEYYLLLEKWFAKEGEHKFKIRLHEYITKYEEFKKNTTYKEIHQYCVKGFIERLIKESE